MKKAGLFKWGINKWQLPRCKQKPTFWIKSLFQRFLKRYYSTFLSWCYYQSWIILLTFLLKNFLCTTLTWCKAVVINRLHLYPFVWPSSLFIMWLSFLFSPGGSYSGRATASYSLWDFWWYLHINDKSILMITLQYQLLFLGIPLSLLLPSHLKYLHYLFRTEIHQFLLLQL